jgi:hypothetical protein
MPSLYVALLDLTGLRDPIFNALAQHADNNTQTVQVHSLTDGIDEETSLFFYEFICTFYGAKVELLGRLPHLLLVVFGCRLCMWLYLIRLLFFEKQGCLLCHQYLCRRRLSVGALKSHSTTTPNLGLVSTTVTISVSGEFNKLFSAVGLVNFINNTTSSITLQVGTLVTDQFMALKLNDIVTVTPSVLLLDAVIVTAPVGFVFNTTL